MSSRLPILSYQGISSQSLRASVVMIIIILLIVACHKDLSDLKPSFPESITFGDTSGMQITNVNRVLMYYEKATFDFDSDDIDDYRIEVEDFGSQSFGSFFVVQILSLHENAQLLTESFLDTTYRLFLQDSSFSGDSSFYEVSYLSSCHETAGYELDIRIRDTILKVNTNDVISDEDSHWTTDTIRLNPTVTDKTIREPFDNGFTTFRLLGVADCHYFTIGQVHYIPFKIEETDQMGWIKVRLLSEQSIEILEYATQKSI